jgi:hypothetical protein
MSMELKNIEDGAFYKGIFQSGSPDMEFGPEFLSEAIWSKKSWPITLGDAIRLADVCFAYDKLYVRNPQPPRSPMENAMEDIRDDYGITARDEHFIEAWHIGFNRDDKGFFFQAYFEHSEKNWMIPLFAFKFYVHMNEA